MAQGGTPMDNIGPIFHRALLATHIAESRYFFLPPAPRADTSALAASGPSSLRLALGGWEMCRPDYALLRQRYPYHVVELVVAGRGRATICGQTFPLEAGVCFAYAPDSPCQIVADPQDPLRKYFFGLDGPGAAKGLAEAGLSPGRLRRIVVIGELAALAETIVAEGGQQGRHAPAVCDLLLRALLLKLSERDATDEVRDTHARARAAYERCREKIDTHARTWASLADIAVGCGLERSSLCRLFRRFARQSPGRYLLRRKMDLAAAHLLTHGGWVKEAASTSPAVSARSMASPPASSSASNPSCLLEAEFSDPIFSAPLRLRAKLLRISSASQHPLTQRRTAAFSIVFL
jgi:AraC-like DNA-binding protein